MPYKDHERNKAAVRAWNKRNRNKVKAAKKRWREKMKRIRLVSFEPKRQSKTYYRNAPTWKIALFRKLRRCGIRRGIARKTVFGI